MTGYAAVITNISNLIDLRSKVMGSHLAPQTEVRSSGPNGGSSARPRDQQGKTNTQVHLCDPVALAIINVLIP